MEKQKAEYKTLLDGILADTKAQAEEIIREAEKSYEQRIKSIEVQTKRIDRETDERISREKEIIERNAGSNISMEKKHINLKIREKIMNSIIEKVKKNIESKISSKEYREILLSWIIEAAIGLKSEKIVIECSFKEKSLLDKKLIEKAKSEIKKVRSIDMEFEVSEKTLLGQGVVLRSVDGRTAFNNQVNTRILRYQSEIRNMIYRDLFSEENGLEK